MFDKIILSHTRFKANMGRITRLMNLAMSDAGEFKAIGFMSYNGLSADIFRLIVVFLHSAVEDLVRSHLPANRQNFSLQSGRDIDKAIKHTGRSPTALASLYPPLTSLARRRNRIVHNADLQADAKNVEPWDIPDVWQLLQWNLTAIAFHYQMLIIFTRPEPAIIERYGNARLAMDENVKIGDQLVNFPQGSLDAQKEAILNIAASLEKIRALLGRFQLSSS
jgi:hypothetical protein